MRILKKGKKLSKDIARVRGVSTLVEKRLNEVSKSDEDRISKLTLEELQDFNKVLQITNFLLCKYEDNKEVHSLLKEFVTMIDADNFGIVNDQIDELVIAADGAIKRIKELQSDVAENFTVDHAIRSDGVPQKPKKSGNNLTKSSTPVYTQEYQAKSKVETEQVI